MHTMQIKLVVLLLLVVVVVAVVVVGLRQPSWPS